MRKEKAIFIVGLIVFVMPITGFPSIFRDIVISASGLFLAFLGYKLYISKKKRVLENQNSMKPFVENQLAD
jgi:hypothetical protein